MTAQFRVIPVFLFAGFAFAQSGTIQGIIMDPAGGRVPNAKVTAVDQDKQVIARETLSNQEGAFALRSLLPARYTVRVEASGFKTLERTDLVLDQNQVMALGTVTIEVGQTTESVTVEAEVPLVETDTAHRGFTVTSRQVTQLPLNGRDFTSLIRTLPGIVHGEASDFRLAFNNTDQFNVNGLRGSMNNVFLDGSINTDVGANDGQYYAGQPRRRRRVPRTNVDLQRRIRPESRRHDLHQHQERNHRFSRHAVRISAQ
jgi:hypothetical protein